MPAGAATLAHGHRCSSGSLILHTAVGSRRRRGGHADMHGFPVVPHCAASDSRDISLSPGGLLSVTQGDIPVEAQPLLRKTLSLGSWALHESEPLRIPPPLPDDVLAVLAKVCTLPVPNDMLAVLAKVCTLPCLMICGCPGQDKCPPPA